MMRETISGVLRRNKTRKGLRNWAADFGRLLAEQAGTVEPRYWPETAYISGDEQQKNPGNRGMMWGLCGRWTKALEGVADGSRVTIVATVRRWDNGIGGDCTRIKLVAHEPAAVSP